MYLDCSDKFMILKLIKFYSLNKYDLEKIKNSHQKETNTSACFMLQLQHFCYYSATILKDLQNIPLEKIEDDFEIL